MPSIQFIELVYAEYMVIQRIPGYLPFTEL